MRNKFVVRWVSCLLSLCLATSTPANPLGGSFVGGSANGSISGQGTSHVTIHENGNHGIIDWNSFSIGLGENTTFVQPSPTAAILNYVLSANPSLIYGTLNANGRVYLVNPAGILVGPTGVVDTHSFIASTLDISASAFKNSASLTFSGSSTASVNNQGTIRALGGDIYLIANNVQNSGTLKASGTVGLGAGSQVLLAQVGTEHVSVLAGNSTSGGQGTGVDNEGQIQAATAELKAAGGNVYALAINNGGAVRANTVVNEGGKIYLSADGGNIQNSGTLSASGTAGDGGTVIVNGGHNAANASTVVNTGTIDASSATARGGTVNLLGDNVGLLGNGSINVSGATGGGTALVGGDLHGQNPAILNAENTTIASGATINADAVTSGDGGKVIVWSDEHTEFYGSISARGGSESGNGGFSEVSGKNQLTFGGTVDLSAAHGSKGSLLLDPSNIVISVTGTNLGTNVLDFGDSASNSVTITDASLSSELNVANVTLRANNDIIYSNNVTVLNATGSSLTNQAGRSIIIDPGASITLTNASGAAGSFTATFNDTNATVAFRAPGQAEFFMSPTSSINAPGGIVINAGTLDQDNTTHGGVSANTGNITLANLSTKSPVPGDTGGNIQVTITNGATANIIIGGTINASGTDNPGSGDGGAAGTITMLTSGSIFANTGPILARGGAATAAGANGGNGGVIDLAGGNGVAISTTVDARGGSSSLGTAGTDGTIILTAAQGAVTENGGGSVLAGSLVVTAQNSSALTQPGNSVGVLAADITGAGHSFSYVNTNGLTIGTVNGVSGITTSNGNVSVTVNAGDLVVATNISAGTGNVGLTAALGAVTEIGGSAVSASNLVVNAGTSVAFDGINVVSNLTAFAGSGSITGTGIVNVANQTTLGAGSNIDLSGNFGGLVTVSNGLDVSLTSQNSLTIGGTSSNLTATASSGSLTLAGYSATNNLTAIATNGDILETGVVDVGGNAVFTLGTAGANLLMATQPNDFGGSVTVNGALTTLALRNTNSGASLPTGNYSFTNLTLAFDNASINLGSTNVQGSLSLTSGGSITLTNVSVGSNATLVAATNVTLEIVGVTNNLMVTASNGYSFLTNVVVGGNSAITASNGVTIAMMTNGGFLAITNTGPADVTITMTTNGGDLTVATPGSIWMTNSAAGGNASLTAGTNISLDTVGVASNLTADAASGYTLLNSLTIGGNLTNSAGTTATLLGSQIGGSAVITANNDVTLSAVGVGGSLTANSVAGNAWVTNVNVGGSGSVLASDNASLNTVSVANNLAVAGTNGSTLLASVSAGGNLSDIAGTIATVLGSQIGGSAVIKAGSTATVGATSVTNSLTVTSANGDSVLTNVYAGGNLTVGATNGNALLTNDVVGGSANLFASGNVSLTVVSVTNNLTLNAPNGYTLLTNVYAGGNLTNTAGTTATVLDSQVKGSAVIKAGTTATLGGLSVTNSLTVTSANGDSVLTNVFAGGNLTVSATNGSALLTNDTVGGSANLFASGNVSLSVVNATNNLTLNAGTGYTLLTNVYAGGNLTNTAATTATVFDSQVGGSAVIKAGTTATLGGVSVTNSLTVTSANGDSLMTNVFAGGNLTVGATNGNALLTNDTVGGSATLFASGNVNLVATSVTNNLTLNAANGYTLLTNVYAGGNLTNTAKTTATVLASEVGGSAVIKAGTTATLGGLSVTNDLTVTSANGDSVLTNVLAGGNLTVGATNGNALMTNDTVGGTGSVFASSNVTLTVVNVGSNLNLTAGSGYTLMTNVTVGGNLTNTAATTATVLSSHVGRAASITAKDDITLVGTTDRGNLSASSQTGNIWATNVNVGGSSRLLASTNVALVSVSVTNNLTVGATNGYTQLATVFAGNLTNSAAKNVVINNVKVAGSLVAQAATGTIDITGAGLTAGPFTTLTANSIGINAPLVTLANSLVILQPVNQSENLTLSGPDALSGGTGNYVGLNHLTPNSTLRIGNSNTFTGSITIGQSVILGSNTNQPYSPVQSLSPALSDTTTLSLMTHGGQISQAASTILKVPRLNVVANTVKLENVHNDFNFLAGRIGAGPGFALVLSDANTLDFLFQSQNQITGIQGHLTSAYDGAAAGFLYFPIDGVLGLSPLIAVSITTQGGTAAAQEVVNGFNIGVSVPESQARFSEVRIAPLDTKAYTERINETLGPGAVWSSYALNSKALESPYRPEQDFKIEAQPKFISAYLLFGGSTPATAPNQ